MSVAPAEDLMEVLLDDIAYTDTVLPAEPWDDIYPIAAFNRLPNGGVTNDGLQDRALMAFLVIDKDRASAQASATRIADRIMNDGFSYNIPLDGKLWLVETVEQTSPAANEIDINPDNRFIEMSFWVNFSLRF